MDIGFTLQGPDLSKSKVEATKLSELSADQIVSKFQATIPVDVVGIAKALGIDVYRDYTLGEDSSGLIRAVADQPPGAGRFEIRVNGNHSLNRQRFTIAHELAHYFLHRDKIGDGIYDDYLYRSGISNSLEVEANKCAANLLMPPTAFKREEFQGASASRLARQFQVSEATMQIRMKELNLAG